MTNKDVNDKYQTNNHHNVDSPVNFKDDPCDKVLSPSEDEKKQYYDGRQPGQWNTVYCIKSWKFIIAESIYVSILLIFAFILCFFTWTAHLNNFISVSSNRYISIVPFIYCFSSGLIGGTLFAIKWLYHSVARQKWHIDRILWRIFTPWISGVFALVMYILMKSGLFSAFDGNAISDGYIAFSIGFLVGYFSDSAMSKFREIANTLFGQANSQR